MAHYLIPSQGDESTEPGFLERSRLSFMTSAASATGYLLTHDATHIPYGRDDLHDLFKLYAKLKEKGVAQNLIRVRHMADEPQYRSWSCSYDARDRAGGIATLSDRAALTATLAESVERYIWRNDAACLSTKKGSEREIGASAVPLAHFVTLSEPLENVSYNWVRAHSLSKKQTCHVPAQLVSLPFAHQLRDTHEPIIRENITTGLATGTSHLSANLSGLLEVIERDAFMILWLNHLSLPRIHCETLASLNSNLAILLQRCARYDLEVSFIQCITDAPTNVIGAVVHDPALQPAYTIGMCAHSQSHRAAEKALLEALRARRNARGIKIARTEPFTISASEVRHFERSLYWMDPERGKLLAFLKEGAFIDAPAHPWAQDTEEEHLARLLDWCRRKNFDCVSIDLSHSAYNVTPWYVHFVIVPQLQPLYQNEKNRILDGQRLSEIPREFGYVPRDTPYIEHPHPFV